MDQSEKKALEDINEYGCHIIHVIEEENYPSFSYSIGIEQTSNHPEIIITGLQIEISHSIINEYNKLIKLGQIFLADKNYNEFLENYNITFKLVDTKFYEDYFTWARWLYRGNNFRALQFIYPDANGIWPWDKMASPEFKWLIPPLYE